MASATAVHLLRTAGGAIHASGSQESVQVNDRIPARAGALATGAGSLLWITGSVAELGGHRAVGLMATHANPIQTTNSTRSLSTR